MERSFHFCDCKTSKKRFTFSPVFNLLQRMPGPDKNFDIGETLQKAKTVFWEKGYDATSISELLAAIGINRSSMYSTFGDKRELFIAALTSYCDQLAIFVEMQTHTEQSPWNSIQSFVRTMANYAAQEPRMGCFANNTSTENIAFDLEVRSILNTLYDNIEASLENRFDAAKKTGEITNPASPKTLAVITNSYLQGMNALSRLGRPTENFIGATDDFLKRIASS